jgi:hypothetical protein
MPMPSSPTLEEPLSPEELQRRMDEAFGGWRPPPQAAPRLKAPEPELSEEELQQHMHELFDRDASRPKLAPSPRAIRSMQRRLRRGSASPPALGARHKGSPR